MPYVPQDVLDRLAALEREVRELRGRSQIRPALTQILHGDVVIGEGGRLIAQAPDGTRIFMTGETPAGDWAVGIARPADGTAALTVGDEDAEGAGQMIRIWNRDQSAQDVIVMDDAFSERFLGRPWMPLQLYPTERQTGYTGTSYDTAWGGITPAQNAVLYLHTSTWANTGGAQVRVRLVHDGDETILDEWDCPAGQWTERMINRPLHGIGFLDGFLLRVEHRNKTAGQNCETRVWSAFTRNTYTADEAPDPPISAAAATAPDDADTE